jgi:AAA family ATP:ADP antiporter
MNALILVGDPALSFLDNAFYRPGQSSATMLRLVQIIGVIGGNRAKEVLWNKIDYPDKVIVSQVLLALGESGFKAGMSQISRIKYAIESDIGAIAWNLGALTEVGDSEESRVVRRALNREIKNDIEHIYMLLAMLYDTRSIQLVKENIDSGTAEGVTYAIELLDVFLSEQLKMRVLPVLDDLSTSEKIKRLEIFYPRVQLDEKLVLKFLINRDFTQSNRWTKATVLHQIGVQKISEFNLDLIAQIFNPDQLIRETAAWALNQIDPALYTTHVARLGADVKRALDRSVLGGGVNLMLFDKVLFFQQTELFEDVPGITLSYLADVTKTINLDEGKTLIVDESQNTDFYIVFQGEVDYYDHNKKVITYQPGQFVGERLSSSGYINSHALKASKKSVLLKVNKEQFYELLAEHVHMADKFLEYI